MISDALLIFLTPVYLIIIDALAIIGALAMYAKFHIDLAINFWPFVVFSIFIIGTGSVLLTIAIWEILLKEIKLN